MKHFLFLSCVVLLGAGCASVTSPAAPSVDESSQETAEVVDEPATDKVVPDDVGDLSFMPPDGAARGPGELGPWNNRLMSAMSKDAVTWEKTGQVITDQGDVPDLVVVDGTVYLYYTAWTVAKGETNQTVVAMSQDNGQSWTYSRLVLEGFEQMSSPVDPDIKFLDGVFHLLLTSDPHDGQGPRTYYAQSQDGIHFEKQGVAFSQAGEQVLDPNTILINDVWHYFAGGSPGGNWHATSADGETFTLVGTERFLSNGRSHMMSNGILVGDLYRYWAFSNQGTDIVSFSTTNGDTWDYEGVALAFDSMVETGHLKDAAVVQLPDGSYLMVYVTAIPE